MGLYPPSLVQYGTVGERNTNYFPSSPRKTLLRLFDVLLMETRRLGICGEMDWEGEFIGDLVRIMTRSCSCRRKLWMNGKKLNGNIQKSIQRDDAWTLRYPKRL